MVSAAVVVVIIICSVPSGASLSQMMKRRVAPSDSP